LLVLAQVGHTVCLTLSDNCTAVSLY